MNSYRKVFFIAMTISFLLGCASHKPFWGDPETGFILNHQLQKGQTLDYSMSGTQQYSMEQMGQTINSESKFSTDYSILAEEKTAENNLKSVVTINSMKVEILSPQKMEPDLSDLSGKSFEVTYTPKGKEVDFSNIDSIRINLGPMGGGKQSIRNYFRNVFPDLPENPVKIGDTWNTKEDMNRPQSGMNIHIAMDENHKLLGTETVNGMECLKIETKATGTLDGSGEQGGAQLNFEGDLQNNSTWYFAYKKGVFVQSSSDVFVEGTVVVSGPTDMTMPMTQESKIEVKLVTAK